MHMNLDMVSLRKTKLGKLVSDARHTIDSHPKLGQSFSYGLNV